MWTFSWSTGVLVFHYKSCEISKQLLQDGENTKWRGKTENKCIIGKTLTKRRETKEKEMVVLSEKGKKIRIKTEVALSSMKPFRKQPVEHEEEASKRKYEVIGTNIETEYEEIDTEEEESEVRKLTKEELEIYQQYKEFYTIQGRTKGKIPSFSYIQRLKFKEHYPRVPSDVAEMLSHPIEGEVQDTDHITEQEVIEIERKHAMVPWRSVNIRPKKKTVILCIDPDSDSDVVIEEGEGDFKERCIIIKGEERNVEEEAEQADDKQSEQLTEAGTEPGTSLTTEQENEDKDETISSTLTQDFDKEKVEREFINLTSHYQQISESFRNLIEEVPHMKKHPLATHLADMPILPIIKVTTEEKVLSMYGQWYEEEPSKVQEEYDPKVHRESMEKKLQSTINSIGEQSALLLMAVGDCIVNKKSQAEIARKYGIPRSRVQWAMSGKKGGKQYWQEQKRKISEEDSISSQKLRRSEKEQEEKELKRVDDRPTPVAESHNSENDSDELPDVQLWRTSYIDFQSFSGPPPSSHWEYTWKSFLQ